MLTGLTPGMSKGCAWEAGTMTAVNLVDVDKTRRSGIRMNEITDGASHTFLILEDAGRSERQSGMWANGHNCLGHDRGPVNQTRSSEIYSDHPGMAHALLADGSVMSLAETTSSDVLGAMSTRNGRERVDLPD
jgi:hypothetical protein